jgi:hypothetical protein
MRVLITKQAGATDYWRFPWLRCEDRCLLEWKPALAQEDRDLVMRFVKAPRGSWYTYYPLETEAALSRQFAAVQDADGVMAFANQYGLLGLEGVPRYRRQYDEINKIGERVDDWLGEADELRDIYEVWDAVADADAVPDSDANTLRALFVWGGMAPPDFSWTPNCVPALVPKAGRKRVNQDRFPAIRLELEELLRKSRLFIAERFNRKMNGMASPTLLLDLKGGLHPHSQPASLLGALWLEFGHVASGERRQIICEICKRWMDVTQHRKDKRVHTSCL